MDVKKYKGTGLGLTISKRLIEILGGSIDFKTEEGIGTEFFVRVSLKKS